MQVYSVSMHLRQHAVTACMPIVYKDDVIVV